MKHILWIIILITILFPKHVYAELYNDGFIQQFEIESKLPDYVIDFNNRIVRNVKKDVNFNKMIITSPYSLSGVNGYAVITYDYIVIANPSGDYKSLLHTILHEIGHLKCKEIDIKRYTSFVYGTRYTDISIWEQRWEEEFAEDYKMHILETKYPDIINNFDNYKLTKRAYNRKKVGAFFIKYLK